MSTRTLSLSLVLAMILVAAAPAVSATWRMSGGFEPDTTFDAEGGFMHLNPDVDANANIRKVYFNAMLGYDQFAVNPNQGALDSRVLVEGFQFPYAWLGVWKDCNNDGYIGMAAGALVEYASELLDNDAICPDGLSDHNSNGWVYEFLWIGPGDNVFDEADRLPRLIEDAGSFVWGDSGLPGREVPGGCYINPPTGTFSSTGGMMSYADCLAGRVIFDNVNLIDSTLGGNTGLGFEEDMRDTPQCSSSALNIWIGLFADSPQCPRDGTNKFEDAEDPAVTAFDCDERTPVTARDPTAESGRGSLSVINDPTDGELGDIVLADEDGTYLTLDFGTPTSPTFNVDGSYYDAIENADGATLGGCEGASVVFYVTPESEVGNEGSVQRDNFAFQFTDDFAHFLLFGFDNELLGEDYPRYGGLAAGHGGSGLLPAWTADHLQSDSVLLRGDFQPAGASYWSFYAYVAPGNGLDIPATVTSAYGAEWCDGATTGVVRGFDCDAENWWNPAKGASPMPKTIWSDKDYGRFPGEAYNLRDIDCYDGSVLGTPVAVGGAALSLDGYCPVVG